MNSPSAVAHQIHRPIFDSRDDEEVVVGESVAASFLFFERTADDSLGAPTVTELRGTESLNCCTAIFLACSRVISIDTSGRSIVAAPVECPRRHALDLEAFQRIPGSILWSLSKRHTCRTRQTDRWTDGRTQREKQRGGESKLDRGKNDICLLAGRIFLTSTSPLAHRTMAGPCRSPPWRNAPS